MDELGVGGSKQAFTHRTETRLGWRSGLLDALVSRQESFEVCALEFRASIDDDDLRQSRMPSDTLAQDHHRGAIAWRIEREIERQCTPRKRIDEKGTLWTPESAARSQA